MPQIDFGAIFSQLKDNVLSLAENTVKNYVKDAKSDAQKMLTGMKVKLERWTMLLANGQLTTEDFEWLVYSQTQLVKMAALEKAGLAQIRVDQFKGSVVNLVIDTIFQLIKV